MRVTDLAGHRFGYLTVIKRIGSRWGHSLWECKCDCGESCKRTPNQLTQNDKVSCGCMTKKQSALCKFPPRRNRHTFISYMESNENTMYQS